MNIYENIKSLCDKQGISTYRLCQELGFSTALMSQWKSGRQEPSRKKLQQIADYFNVTVEYLIVGEAKKSPDSELSEEDKITFDDFTYAMYDHAKDLTEDEKKMLLEMAEFMKKKREL